MRTRLFRPMALILGAALLGGCSPGARIELDFLPYLESGGYGYFTAAYPVELHDVRGQEVQITSDFRAPPGGASVSYAKVEVGLTATGTLHYRFEVSAIEGAGHPTRGWIEVSLFVVPGEGSPWGVRVAGPKRFGPARAGAWWTWEGRAHLDQTLTRGLADGSATFGVVAQPVDYYVRLPDLGGGSLYSELWFTAKPLQLMLTIP